MEIIIGIAVLAGLLWGGWFLWYGHPIDGTLVFMLAMTCFGYYFVHFDLGPVPLTIDRLLLMFLAAQYGLHRLLGRNDPKPLGWADWFLGAFIAVLVGSLLTTDATRMLKGDTSPTWRLITGYLTPLAVYWFVRQAPIDERHVRRVHGCLAVFGIYLGIISLLEMAKLWSFVFPTYIADPTVGLHFGRARGPLVQAVSFGHYIGVALLAAWMWRPTLGRTGQIVLTLLMPLFVAGVLFSFTRSVWMGAAAGCGLLLLIVLPNAWRGLMIGSGVLAGILLLSTSLESLMGFQREQSAAETKESAELRVSFAYVSWKMFQDRPWLGVGFGGFPIAKLDYLDDRSTELEINLLRPYVHHNTLLSLLTETGAIGLSLFLATLTSWVVIAWRLVRSPLSEPWVRRQGLLMLGAVAMYFPQLLFHEMSYSAMDNSLLFLLAGLTVGCSNLVQNANCNAPAISAANPIAIAVTILDQAHGRPSVGLSG